MSPIVLALDEKKGLTYDEQVKLLNEKVKKALVGKYLSKGEMFSYFQFGGSDIVVVFERKANVNITAGVLPGGTTTSGVHYPVRSQYAFSNIDKLLPVK